MDQEKIDETINVIFYYLLDMDGMERLKADAVQEIMAYGEIRDPEAFKRRFNEVLDQNLIHKIEENPID